MPTGPRAAEHRADAVRRMSGWIRDQHAERDWGNNLHSVCCWHVHASVDVWVSSVHGWVRDELVGCSRREHVYGVRCWAVQRFLGACQLHKMYSGAVPAWEGHQLLLIV